MSYDSILVVQQANGTHYYRQGREIAIKHESGKFEIISRREDDVLAFYRAIRDIVITFDIQRHNVREHFGIPQDKRLEEELDKRK